MKSAVILTPEEYKDHIEDSQKLKEILDGNILYSDGCNGIYMHSITKDDTIEKLTKELERINALDRNKFQYYDPTTKDHMTFDVMRRNRDYWQKEYERINNQLTAIKSKWWYKLFGG